MSTHPQYDRIADLFAAIKKDDLQAVMALITEGVEVNIKRISSPDPGLGESNPNRKSPLTIAAQEGRLEIASCLIAAGAKVNPGESLSTSPLRGAIKAQSLALVDLLLTNGADPNYRTRDGLSDIWFAASTGNLDIVKKLIAAGGSVNIHDNVEDNIEATPLAFPATENPDVLAFLVEQGLKLDVRDHHGRSPLGYAAGRGAEASVKYLLGHGVDVNERDQHTQTALFHAAVPAQQTCLQLLLDAGAEVNARDIDGLSPLHRAAWCDREIAIKLLLDHGAEIDTTDSRGETPLMAAARNKSGGAIRLLPLHGADVHLRDEWGQTALMHAAKKKDAEDVLRDLLENGADPEQRDNDGLRALDHAQDAGHRSNAAFLELHMLRPKDKDKVETPNTRKGRRL